MRRGKGRKRPTPLRRAPSEVLDPRAVKAAALFVRVLARCGCTPSAIEQTVSAACRRVPRSWSRRSMQPEIDDAAHVLTLWFSDPAYVDAQGAPRPLPLTGSGRSLQSLARRVNPKLEAQEVLTFLERGRALRKTGQRFVPRSRIVSLRGAGASKVRHLRNLLDMLKALEHNILPPQQVGGWFMACAENHHVPVSACGAFDTRARALGNRLLYQLDADLHRRERARKPGERCIRVGVGVYRFEDTEFRAEQPPRGGASQRRRSGR